MKTTCICASQAPCTIRCTCVNPFSSSGCSECERYGEHSPAEVMRQAILKLVIDDRDIIGYARTKLIENIKAISSDGTFKHVWKETDDFPKFTYCRVCGIYPPNDSSCRPR